MIEFLKDSGIIPREQDMHAVCSRNIFLVLTPSLIHLVLRCACCVAVSQLKVLIGLPAVAFVSQGGDNSRSQPKVRQGLATGEARTGALLSYY